MVVAVGHLDELGADFDDVFVLALVDLGEGVEPAAHEIELGAEDYLPKPFPAAILQARVQSCLASKRMSDQLRKYTEWLFGKTLFSQAVATPGSLDLTQQERTLVFADIRVNDFKLEVATAATGLDALVLSLEIRRGSEPSAAATDIAAKAKLTFEVAPEVRVLELGTLAKEFETSVKAPRFVDRRI